MPTLAIVSPEEWLSRTSVKFARRSASTQKIDDAYRAYHRNRSEQNKKMLHIALDGYLREKGGHWEKVERNNNSGGLMKYIHGVVGLLGNLPQTRSAADRDVLLARIPEARHGVLYLWENTQVEIQFGKIILEGALSLGSTAVSTASSLQGFQPGDPRAPGYAAGSAAGKLGGIAVGALVGKTNPNKGSPVAPRPLPPPPLMRQGGVRSLNELDAQPSNMQAFKNILGTAFDKIHAAICSGIKWIWEKILLNQGAVFSVLGQSLEKLTLYVLEKVCTACVPFVGAAIDLGRGVFETVSGIKDRLEAYFLSSKFVVAQGHPALIADSIEKQMNWAIGAGMFSVIKGGAKLGMTFMTAGASVIIDAVAAGLEFATKFMLRLVEGHAIKKFLADVADACRTKVGGDPARPAIVHDTTAFNDLFKRGCAASPCISMVTLNSGITGDQMMYMKMFDDTSTPAMVSGDSFNSATAYFTSLKQHGRNYVRASGFAFSSTKNDVKGYLSHAINHHESGNLSMADAALRMAS